MCFRVLPANRGKPLGYPVIVHKITDVACHCFGTFVVPPFITIDVDLLARKVNDSEDPVVSRAFPDAFQRTRLDVANNTQVTRSQFVGQSRWHRW